MRSELTDAGSLPCVRRRNRIARPGVSDQPTGTVDQTLGNGEGPHATPSGRSPFLNDRLRPFLGAEMPALLDQHYTDAVRQLPGTVASAARAAGWSHEPAQCTLAWVAVAQGQRAFAEPLLELSAEPSAVLRMAERKGSHRAAAQLALKRSTGTRHRAS
jgi:hypothetical protein